jgi:hypothetical protein
MFFVTTAVIWVSSQQKPSWLWLLMHLLIWLGGLVMGAVEEERLRPKNTELIN